MIWRIMQIKEDVIGRGKICKNFCHFLQLNLRRRGNLTSVIYLLPAFLCAHMFIERERDVWVRGRTDSMKYRKCVSNFLSSLLTNRQWLYYEPIMARTQILIHRGGRVGGGRGQKKAFGAVSQKELTRV